MNTLVRNIRFQDGCQCLQRSDTPKEVEQRPDNRTLLGLSNLKAGVKHCKSTPLGPWGTTPISHCAVARGTLILAS